MGLILILPGAGCGAPPSDSDAQEVFDSANRILHEMHVEAFNLDPARVPSTYEFACDEGRALMTTIDKGAGGFDLLHEFEDCRSAGDTFSGNLDYLDVQVCEPGFAFDIRGELTVPERGIDLCVVAAREECDGTITGAGCESP